MGRLTAIDYAVKDKSLYFAEVGGDSIGLLRLKDWGRLSWKQVVAVEGTVTSLALDWLSGNLYWIGGQPPSICVAAPGGAVGPGAAQRGAAGCCLAGAVSSCFHHVLCHGGRQPPAQRRSGVRGHGWHWPQSGLEESPGSHWPHLWGCQHPAVLGRPW